MSDYDIGDVARTFFTVRDATDALIDATVVHTYLHPDGVTETAGTVVHDSLGKYHADIPLDAAGVWRWEFVATGAATGKESGALVVGADWSGPEPFVPSLREIGTYVPTRTVPVGVPGSAVPLGTFDTTTVPNDEAVTQLAKAAARWVASRAGTVDESLYGLAADVAAIRAAAFVELAYPVRDAEVNVWQALFDAADAAMASLVEANEAAGESPPGEGLLPVYSFPEPFFNSDTYPIY